MTRTGILEDPADDLRSAVALVQALMQADPWDSPATAQLVAQLVEISWPHEDPAQSLSDAVYALAALALGLADQIVCDKIGRGDATPMQIVAFFADLATRVGDDTPPAAA